MASTKSGQSKGPRMTTVERYQRDQAIFRRWLRFDRVVEIAEDNDLSDKQVRTIVKNMMRARAFSDKTPDEIVDEMAARIEDVIREVGRIGEDSDDDSRKLNAAMKRLDALNAYFALMVRSGRVQAEPERVIVEHDIARVVDVIVDVFERYKVPKEAQVEVRDAVGALEARGARELPSGG